MLFKNCKLIEMTIRVHNVEDSQNSNTQKNTFLNRIRWQYAVCDAMKKVSERVKKEDGIEYIIVEYLFVINKSKLKDLKHYIEYITNHTDFTVEIEELY